MKETGKWKIYVSVLILSVLAYGAMLHVHFTCDTIGIILYPEITYKAYLASGRLIPLLFDFVTVGLGINLATTSIINTVIFILLLSWAYAIVVQTIYELFGGKRKIWNCILLSFVSFINVFYIEIILFTEVSIQYALGLLFSAFAIKYWYKEKKWIVLLYIILSVQCYQIFASIFIAYALLITFVKYEGRISWKVVKESAIPFVITMIAWGISFFVCQLSRLLGFVTVDRLSANKLGLKERVLAIVQNIGRILRDCNNLTRISWFPLVILLILLLILLAQLVKKQNISCLVYVVLLLAAVFLGTNLTMIALNQGANRTVIPFLSIYSICAFVISYFAADGKTMKMVEAIMLMFAGTQLIFCMLVGYENKISCEKDMEYAKAVYQEIESYEKENGVEVKNISVCYDGQLAYNWDGVHLYSHNTNTRTSLNMYADTNFIYYVSGRKFKRIDDGRYSDYFVSQNWDSYCPEEQLLFEGNNLFWCIY